METKRKERFDYERPRNFVNSHPLDIKKCRAKVFKNYPASRS
jgi:hypothetical protein